MISFEQEVEVTKSSWNIDDARTGLIVTKKFGKFLDHRCLKLLSTMMLELVYVDETFESHTY